MGLHGGTLSKFSDAEELKCLGTHPTLHVELQGRCKFLERSHEGENVSQDGLVLSEMKS